MGLGTDCVVIDFPPPDLRPYQWKDYQEPKFDPAIHLAKWNLDEIRAEAQLINDIYANEDVKMPPEYNNKIGWTSVFQVLSPEGYRVARYSVPSQTLPVFAPSLPNTPIFREILNREKAEGFVKADNRIQLCLRGVTYRSPFLRDFSQSPELQALATALSGEPLVIHPMISNHAHINWGEAPLPGQPPVNVDQWHLDSVSHVIIVLMSDMSEAEGGLLEFVKRPGRTALQMINQSQGEPPAEFVSQVKFPAPGLLLVSTRF